MAWTLPVKPDKIVNLSEVMAYMDGTLLTGITLKADDEGWLIVVKARRDGQSQVHFTGGRTYADAWESLIWEIDHGQMTWRPDKYAK